jgi:hypothetical protein
MTWRRAVLAQTQTIALSRSIQPYTVRRYDMGLDTETLQLVVVLLMLVSGMLGFYAGHANGKAKGYAEGYRDGVVDASIDPDADRSFR